MTSSEEVQGERQELLDRWADAATGWRVRADRVREAGMPVSKAMIERLRLHPGQTVLELAAGPGDTGFMAAALIRGSGHPGTGPSGASGDPEAGPFRGSDHAAPGKLICSDGSEAMLALARERAAALGVDNVEFKRLELEWLDQPTASVDAVLCRWGVMLIVDPAAAVQEMRRVLRPGGSLAVAVWDQADQNPWATIPTQAMIRTGHLEPPDPRAPGMFALAAPGQLAELLAGAGFVEVVVESVDVGRSYPDVEELLAETLDLSRVFAGAFAPLSESQRADVRRELEALAAPFAADDGSLQLPGRSLVGAASA